MTPDKIRELIFRPGGHRLSEGVYALREGLVFTDEENDTTFPSPVYLAFCEELPPENDGYLLSWPDAAERLRYRDGEPWCCQDFDEPEDICCVSQKYLVRETSVTAALHRLAAILCDDAESFRILHFCINNLCNTRTGTNPVEIDGITPDMEPPQT